MSLSVLRESVHGIADRLAKSTLITRINEAIQAMSSGVGDVVEGAENLQGAVTTLTILNNYFRGWQSKGSSQLVLDAAALLAATILVVKAEEWSSFACALFLLLKEMGLVTLAARLTKTWNDEIELKGDDKGILETILSVLLAMVSTFCLGFLPGRAASSFIASLALTGAKDGVISSMGKLLTFLTEGITKLWNYLSGTVPEEDDSMHSKIFETTYATFGLEVEEFVRTNPHVHDENRAQFQDYLDKAKERMAWAETNNKMSLALLAKDLAKNLTVMLNNGKTNSRRTPKVLYLVGAGGVGKTSLVAKFIRQLAKKTGRTEQHKRGKFVYNRDPNSKYWSGYEGQKVIVYDDVMNGDSTSRKAFCAEFLMVVNSCAFQAEMAAVGDKGRIMIEPEYILVTSNKVPRPDGVAVSAFVRRCHCLYNVEKNPLFLKGQTSFNMLRQFIVKDNELVMVNKSPKLGGVRPEKQVFDDWTSLDIDQNDETEEFLPLRIGAEPEDEFSESPDTAQDEATSMQDLRRRRRNTSQSSSSDECDLMGKIRPPSNDYTITFAITMQKEITTWNPWVDIKNPRCDLPLWLDGKIVTVTNKIFNRQFQRVEFLYFGTRPRTKTLSLTEFVIRARMAREVPLKGQQEHVKLPKTPLHKFFIRHPDELKKFYNRLQEPERTNFFLSTHPKVRDLIVNFTTEEMGNLKLRGKTCRKCQAHVYQTLNTCEGDEELMLCKDRLCNSKQHMTFKALKDLNTNSHTAAAMMWASSEDDDSVILDGFYGQAVTGTEMSIGTLSIILVDGEPTCKFLTKEDVMAPVVLEQPTPWSKIRKACNGFLQYFSKKYVILGVVLLGGIASTMMFAKWLIGKMMPSTPRVFSKVVNLVDEDTVKSNWSDLVDEEYPIENDGYEVEIKRETSNFFNSPGSDKKKNKLNTRRKGRKMDLKGAPAACVAKIASAMWSFNTVECGVSLNAIQLNNEIFLVNAHAFSRDRPSYSISLRKQQLMEGRITHFTKNVVIDRDDIHIDWSRDFALFQVRGVPPAKSLINYFRDHLDEHANFAMLHANPSKVISEFPVVEAITFRETVETKHTIGGVERTITGFKGNTPACISDGDCGSVVISDYDGVTIHGTVYAGWGNNGFVYATAIPGTVLRRAMQKFCMASQKIPTKGDETPLHIDGACALNVVESGPVSTISASNLIRSPLHEELTEAFGECPKVPARQCVPALEKALNKWTLYTSGGKAINTTAYKQALKFVRYEASKLPAEAFKLSSQQSAIIGDKYSVAMDKHTSCGYGYPKAKDQYLDFTTGEIIDEKLAEDVDELLTQYHDGIAPGTTFKAALKDEKRTMDRVLQCKTRVIFASPVHKTIADRMIFNKFIHYSKKLPWYAPGMNPTSQDWTQMATRHITSHSAQHGHFSVDYSGFDSSQQTNVMCDIMKAATANRDLRVSGMMITSMIDSYQCNVHAYGTTFSKDNGMPSGCTMTTCGNTWYNFFLNAYAYCCHKLEAENVLPNYESFKSGHTFTAYGDDVVVTSPIPADSFCKYVRVFGTTATAADKSDDIKKGRFEDMTFLGRGFTKLPNLPSTIWVAPLDKDIVMSSMYFMHKKGSTEDFVQTVRNALTAAASHGEGIYDQIVDFLRNSYYAKSTGAFDDLSYASIWEQAIVSYRH